MCSRAAGIAALQALTAEAVTQSQAPTQDNNIVVVPLPVSPLVRSTWGLSMLAHFLLLLATITVMVTPLVRHD